MTEIRAFGHIHRKRREGPPHPIYRPAAADDHRELRHLRLNRGHHLHRRRDPAGLVLLPDHEAGDVLQEDERHAALRAQLDEVRAFERRLGKQDAVVGDDADGVPPDSCEAGDERRTVAGLELVELAAVDNPREHFPDVVGFLDVRADDAVDLIRRIVRRYRRRDFHRHPFRPI
jgi:hypothetical protein